MGVAHDYASCNCILIELVFLHSVALAIRCYQCSSQTDPKGIDNCGAYKAFNKTQNIAIECNSDESHMPGSFCMKVVHQSPRGFIWDGRWRQVIRQCASVSETGVTGVCNWGVYENGVYWEECYCVEDECNSAPKIRATSIALLGLAVLLFGAKILS
uniref:Protein quiver n=1 Tax=Anopheles maculatus TaxID=74869 RepID=A0A182SY11_9DIPT